MRMPTLKCSRNTARRTDTFVYALRECVSVSFSFAVCQTNYSEVFRFHFATEKSKQILREYFPIGAFSIESPRIEFEQKEFRLDRKNSTWWWWAVDAAVEFVIGFVSRVSAEIVTTKIASEKCNRTIS